MNEEQIADLEKQVGELEAKVEDVLDKRESDSMPDSREVVKPKKPKKPGMKLHDNKATHMTKGKSSDNGDDDEDDEDDMEKAKKKPSDDEEDDDDMEKAEDDSDLKKAKKKAKADDGEDGDGEDDWSEAADAKKKGTMKKRAPSAEDTLVFKGQTILKSKVGAAQFGMLKALTTELENSATKLAKAEDETLLANLRKRADDEFPHVPGTTDQRALMLKVVTGLPDEDMRKSFEAVFKSAEKLSKTAFSAMGVSSFKNGTIDDVKKSADDFTAKVDEVSRTDKITKDAAMQKVRKAHPDLFKAYQGQN